MTGTPPLPARRLAITLAALILLGWGTGVLVLHVFPGFFHTALDRPVNRWFHHHHTGMVTTAMRWISPLGSAPVTFVVTLVAGGAAALLWRRRAAVVSLGLGYAGGSAIAFAVKLLVRRGQSEVPGGLGGVTQLAFPSGHATLSAALYGTMAALVILRAAGARTRNGRWVRAGGGLVLIGLAVAIGVSRVYNSQHDPSDVLAGWLLGGLWAAAVTSAVSRCSQGGDGQATRWEARTENTVQPHAPARREWATPAGT